jgi:hypothetical protein
MNIQVSERKLKEGYLALRACCVWITVHLPESREWKDLDSMTHHWHLVKRWLTIEKHHISIYQMPFHLCKKRKFVPLLKITWSYGYMAFNSYHTVPSEPQNLCFKSLFPLSQTREIECERPCHQFDALFHDKLAFQGNTKLVRYSGILPLEVEWGHHLELELNPRESWCPPCPQPLAFCRMQPSCKPS